MATARSPRRAPTRPAVPSGRRDSRRTRRSAWASQPCCAAGVLMKSQQRSSSRKETNTDRHQFATPRTKLQHLAASRARRKQGDAVRCTVRGQAESGRCSPKRGHGCLLCWDAGCKSQTADREPSDSVFFADSHFAIVAAPRSRSAASNVQTVCRAISIHLCPSPIFWPAAPPVVSGLPPRLTSARPACAMRHQRRRP